MWRFLLLLCFSSLFVTRSFAQFEQWKFTRIDASDGLSDNSVQHILQLPDGRLAVTTAGNINLYDGSQFKYAGLKITMVHTMCMQTMKKGFG